MLDKIQLDGYLNTSFMSLIYRYKVTSAAYKIQVFLCTEAKKEWGAITLPIVIFTVVDSTTFL